MDKKIITVLVVDDDASFATVIRQYLKRYQDFEFAVVVAQDANSVLEQLRTNPSINLILMDYYLPDASGLEITKRISDEHFEVPIIFLTANKDFRAAIEAMKFGAEDYLLKEDIKDTILPRTVVNVYEKWQLKKEINEAEKQKILVQKRSEAIKELVVTMCHEFNNPLAAIKISTAILTRQASSESEKELLNTFNRNVNALEGEITKLRDLNFEGGL